MLNVILYGKLNGFELVEITLVKKRASEFTFLVKLGTCTFGVDGVSYGELFEGVGVFKDIFQGNVP